jgi:hypothetical protein
MIRPITTLNTMAPTARATPRQYGAGDGGDGVGQHLVRARAQVLHDRRLADEDRDRAGDEERGNQTQQHVLACVPLEQMQRFEHGAVEPGASHRQSENGRERRHPEHEPFPLTPPVHD